MDRHARVWSGCDETSAQVRVEFIRGNDHARPGLLDLPSPRGVLIDQENLAAADSLGGHHLHSFSSKWVGVGRPSK